VDWENRVPTTAVAPVQGQIRRSFGHDRTRWLASDYHVRGQVVRQITSHFGVQPTRDAFANAQNRRFPLWWGPGSPDGEDAFSQDWSGRVLWFNPPFDLLDQVLEKIIQDQAHGILVLPEWNRRRFLRKATALCLDEIIFPEGFCFFKRPTWVSKGLRWPVRVMLVCGHSPRCVRGRFVRHHQKSKWQVRFTLPEEERSVRKKYQNCEGIQESASDA